MDFNALRPVTDHPIFQLIGFLVGVLGLVFAYVFYRRSIKESLPRYSIEAGTLAIDMSSRLTGLEIHFNGKRQERVTVAKFYFWNDGREPITPKSIASHDPLRIEVQKGAELLSVLLRAPGRAACNVTLNATHSDDAGTVTIPITFDFLDYRDGFVIEIAHNGPPRHPMRIAGTVIGGKPIEFAPFYPDGSPYWGRWLGIFNFIFMFVSGGLSLLAWAVARYYEPQGFLPNVLGFGLFVGLSAMQFKISDRILPRLPEALRRAVPPGEFYRAWPG